MSSAVRNWSDQLIKRVQQDWNKLSKAFRKNYRKAATPEADSYFTERQKPAKTVLEFLYRLKRPGSRLVFVSGSRSPSVPSISSVS
jgi:mRNA-degrading endonuclease RelE of RelBE toxin-antitoxin system